jgi:hypothetical protein
MEVGLEELKELEEGSWRRRRRRREESEQGGR